MVSPGADFLSESGVTGTGGVGIWMRMLGISATQSEIIVPFSWLAINFCLLGQWCCRYKCFLVNT
jgi:hypothetical protein